MNIKHDRWTHIPELITSICARTFKWIKTQCIQVNSDSQTNQFDQVLVSGSNINSAILRFLNLTYELLTHVVIHLGISVCQSRFIFWFTKEELTHIVIQSGIGVYWSSFMCPRFHTNVCKMSVKDNLIWKASAVHKHLTDVLKMSVLHTF